MSHRNHLWGSDRRGLAAVEFALIAPVLLMLLGGVTDFGLAMVGKSQLANGLAQGAQFALLQGPGVPAATVKSVVQNGSTRSGMKAAVTATIIGPACFCVAGQPAALTASLPALSASFKCTGTCPAGGSPGIYLRISASYVYQPLMPLYSHIATATISDTVTVRLQ